MRLTFIKSKLDVMTLDEIKEQQRLMNMYYSQLYGRWMSGRTTDKQIKRCREKKAYIDRLVKIKSNRNRIRKEFDNERQY